MTDVKLQAARQLIVENHTLAARRVLETMPTSATAQGWLQKLDELAPAERAGDGEAMPAWEYMEVLVRASERQQVNTQDVLAGQACTTIEQFYTRRLNEFGAQGWELLSEELQGGDCYRLLFKRHCPR